MIMWRGTSLSTLLHGSILVLLLVGIPVITFILDDAARQGGNPGAQTETPDNTDSPNPDAPGSTVARKAQPNLPDWGLQRRDKTGRDVAPPNEDTTGPVAVVPIENLPDRVQERLKRLKDAIENKRKSVQAVPDTSTGLSLNNRPDDQKTASVGNPTGAATSQAAPTSSTGANQQSRVTERSVETGSPDVQPVEPGGQESRDQATRALSQVNERPPRDKPDSLAADAKTGNDSRSPEKPGASDTAPTDRSPIDKEETTKNAGASIPAPAKTTEEESVGARRGGGTFGAGGPGGTGVEGEGARGELSRTRQRKVPTTEIKPGVPVDSVDELLERMAEALPRIGRDAKFGVARDAPFEVQQRRAQNFQRMIRAAQYGHANAQYNVARMLIRGEGTTPDLPAAIKWLEKAAERNYERAQLLLGYIAAGGGGNQKKNLGDADFCWALAERQGSTAAKQARKLLRPKLLSGDILHSQRRQGEFRRLFDFLPKPFREVGGGHGIGDDLMEAAAAGDTRALLKALLQGADVDGQDTFGKTAMINAAWRGRSEILRILLDHGADLEVGDNRRRTPVMWSAINGHADVIDELLVAGAEPDIPDDEGLTPLMRAASNGHKKIVERLIVAGADPFKRDKDGRSALDHARREGHKDIIARLKAVKR